MTDIFGTPITIKDLKNFIANLPDDMLVVANDDGGEYQIYLSDLKTIKYNGESALSIG